MKTAFALVTASVLAVVGCGGSSNSVDGATGDDQDITKDSCSKPALNAAEAEYGNDPAGTHVKALVKSKRYLVTVGINNPEDGAHDYYVDFPSGCSSKPTVTEVPFLPHPLRDAAHDAYDKILWGNANAFPAKLEVASKSLPPGARTQYNTWVKNGKTVCTSVDAYKVSVSGQDTFAVACTRDNSGNVKSYDFSFAIWDAAGADVDQASVFGATSGVGDKGISWQNETFEEQN